MAGRLHTSILLIALVFISAFSANYSALSFQFPANISALLFFGDSILDTGNNNFLISIARADHAPYGVDLPQHKPTGRWSDGFIIPDILAQALGFQAPLPYLDPNANGPAILDGINFASGGSGLLNTTLAAQGVIPLSQQMIWYANYRHELEQQVGLTRSAAILSTALHVISTATNDYLGSYYADPLMQAKYNLTEFRALLLQSYEEDLKELYDVGGRRVAIIGIPPMGCMPLAIGILNITGHGCAGDLNTEAQAFNGELQSVLASLSSSLDGFELSYIDSFDLALHIIQHPADYGFTETNRGCCGDGTFSVGPTCWQLSSACTNISEYFFFDGVHPSQRAYEIVTKGVFLGNLTTFM